MIKSLLKWMLLASIITGCSSTSLLYDNAPWLIRGKIDDYFPLSGSQQQQLKKDINAIFKWHRQQELTHYSGVIKRFNQQFTDGLTREELSQFFEDVSAARIRLFETSIPVASQFLSTVSDRQIDYFDKDFFERKTKESEELNIPPEQYARENFIDFMDNLEDWFGDFDEDQIKQLQVISNARPDNRQYWLKRSKLKHQKFSDLLRSHPVEEKIDRYLHDRFVVSKQSNIREHDIGQKERAFWLNVLLDIDKIINQKQRRYFINRLSDYSSDFVALSQQSSKPFRSNKER